MSSGRLVVVRARPSAATLGLLLTFAVTASLFVPTVIGYVSYDEVKTAEMTVEDVSIADGDSVLELSVAFTNPTGVEVAIIGAETYARVDGDVVTRTAGVSVERTTVPSGGTETFEMRMLLRDGGRERARAGIRDGTIAVSGKIWVEIRGEKTSVMLERD